jgi:hypothetical protein
LPRATRQLVVVDTVAGHPTRPVHPYLFGGTRFPRSSPIPVLSLPRCERSISRVPVRISYLPRELVITSGCVLQYTVLWTNAGKFSTILPISREFPTNSALTIHMGYWLRGNARLS